MGAYTVYLIPVTDDLPAKAYRKAVVRTLLDMGAIDDEEDEEEGGFPPGPRSTDLLTKKGRAIDAFEACEVYASRKPRLVPQVPAVSPSCPNCRQTLEDEFYEAVNAAEDAAEDEPNYAAIRVTCPQCKAAHSVDQLHDEVGIYLARKYVCLEDLQGAMNRRWLSAFIEQTGIKHQVHVYWYT